MDPADSNQLSIDANLRNDLSPRRRIDTSRKHTPGGATITTTTTTTERRKHLPLETPYSGITGERTLCFYFYPEDTYSIYF